MSQQDLSNWAQRGSENWESLEQPVLDTNRGILVSHLGARQIADRLRGTRQGIVC